MYPQNALQTLQSHRATGQNSLWSDVKRVRQIFF